MTGVPLLSRRALGALSLSGGAAVLSGCAAGALLLNEPPDLYTLTPKSTFDSDLPQVGWQLLVEIPVAAAGLDSVRIAIQETPFRVDYFADVAWTISGLCWSRASRIPIGLSRSAGSRSACGPTMS